MSITDRAAQVLQQIDARIAAIAGNWPDESRALRCLKTAIQAHLETLRGQWRDRATEIAERDLAALCEQWRAAK